MNLNLILRRNKFLFAKSKYKQDFKNHDYNNFSYHIACRNSSLFTNGTVPNQWLFSVGYQNSGPLVLDTKVLAIQCLLPNGEEDDSNQKQQCYRTQNEAKTLQESRFSGNGPINPHGSNSHCQQPTNQNDGTGNLWGKGDFFFSN